MDNIILSTRNLDVGYNGNVLIGNICLNVQRGRILTLIGSNGTGKSTILKSIARQLEIISGDILINSVSSKDISRNDFARTVSVMMTEKINPELMTCRDIVESGRYPYTGRLGILSGHDKEKAEESIRLVNAENIADRDFNCISDGQRQKIMLARAICQEPDVLILDEPASFLDIRHKLELLAILKKLIKEKNIAVIMSLHELDLAQKISDYVVCIDSSGIDRCGTPEEIFTDEYITKLYNIKSGSYNHYYGSAELECCKGSPEIFVIAGNGTGISIFHKLQRLGIPFATGVIHENDIDYPAASALASEIISEKAFEPILKIKVENAMKIIDSCHKVICCIDKFGTANHGNKLLMEYAEKKKFLTHI